MLEFKGNGEILLEACALKHGEDSSFARFLKGMKRGKEIYQEWYSSPKVFVFRVFVFFLAFAPFIIAGVLSIPFHHNEELLKIIFIVAFFVSSAGIFLNVLRLIRCMDKYSACLDEGKKEIKKLQEELEIT